MLRSLSKYIGSLLLFVAILHFSVSPGRAGWLDVVGTVGKIGSSLITGGGEPDAVDDSFDGESEVIVTSSEDVIARALDQIKIGEKIAAKTVEMENEVAKVFFRIRTYQAMQGAIWFNLGKSYNELRKDLIDLADEGKCTCAEFCRRTKANVFLRCACSTRLR